MAKNNNKSVLTEDFLLGLYKTCFKNEYILSMVVTYLEPEYLPDKDFQAIHKALKRYWERHRRVPSASLISQKVGSNKGAENLVWDIDDSGDEYNVDETIECLEEFIRQVRLQKVHRIIGELFNAQQMDKAYEEITKFYEWQSSFHLRSPDYIDIVATFDERFLKNRDLFNSTNHARPVTKFYIDELDEMNQGKNLRTQLSCILAATGVGKSHAARWIGKNAIMDGFNVLHFQLEGSTEEVANAYSASLVSCSTYRYENGTLKNEEVERMCEEIKEISGKLFVKSYPKFATNVSTIDIRNGIQEFIKQYGIHPDIVIIDSMDLLTDASGRKWGENAERHKRIAVANNLKDLAADENVWMVVTYQSTIENRDWLNDEKNVLSEYNTAEAKGISRPLTHLVSLNQSDRERKEHTMRIFVAKSRFFEKGSIIRIATDFEHEIFCDRERTLNINKFD